MPSATKQGHHGLGEHGSDEQQQTQRKGQAFTKQGHHDRQQCHRRPGGPQVKATRIPDAGAQFGTAGEISTQIHTRVAQPEVDRVGDEHRTRKESSQQRGAEFNGHDIAGQQAIVEITDEEHGPRPRAQHRNAGQRRSVAAQGKPSQSGPNRQHATHQEGLTRVLHSCGDQKGQEDNQRNRPHPKHVIRYAGFVLEHHH